MNSTELTALKSSLTHAASKTFFALAWEREYQYATGEELLSDPLTACPDEIDPACIDHAETVVSTFLVNVAREKGFDHLVDEIEMVFSDYGDPVGTFGHYLACDAQGVGVGLFGYDFDETIKNSVDTNEFCHSQFKSTYTF